jgi:hypothetical protein
VLFGATRGAQGQRRLSVAEVDRWSPDGQGLLYADVCHLMARCARAIDRKDYALLRDVFHDDAYDDHGLWSGDVDNFIETFDRRHVHIEHAMHLNGNTVLLEVDAERRELMVETYCVAWTRVPPGVTIPGGLFGAEDDGEPMAQLTAVGNRYLDIVSERDGVLRIAFRRVIFEWIALTDVPVQQPFDASWAQGVRTPEDLSHRTLPEARAELARLRGRESRA